MMTLIKNTTTNTNKIHLSQVLKLALLALTFAIIPVLFGSIIVKLLHLFFWPVATWSTLDGLWLTVKFGPVFAVLWGYIRFVEGKPYSDWTNGANFYTFIPFTGFAVTLVALPLMLAWLLNLITLTKLPSFSLLLGRIIQCGAEEIVCRGWLLSKLLNQNTPSTQQTTIALTTSTTVFIVLHILSPSFGVHTVLAQTLFGLALAYITLKSQSLYPAWIIHTAWNWLNYIASPRSQSGATLVYLLQLITLGGLLLWTYRLKK